MKKFVEFLCSKAFIKPDNEIFDKKILDLALYQTFQDVKYHFPDKQESEIIDRIQYNHNELLIFMYRLGSLIWCRNKNSNSLKVIHWLMRELSASEIYYSSQIEEGFYIMHGIGTLIGAETKIGKGFMVYPHCGIMRGCKIGDNVTMYWGSLVKSNLEIGDNVTIGANTLVTKDVSANVLIYGNPNVIRSSETI